MSVRYCLPVPVFHFRPKLLRTVQRGLSAIAGHLVDLILLLMNCVDLLPVQCIYFMTYFPLLCSPQCLEYYNRRHSVH